MMYLAFPFVKNCICLLSVPIVRSLTVDSNISLNVPIFSRLIAIFLFIAQNYLPQNLAQPIGERASTLVEIGKSTLISKSRLLPNLRSLL